MKFKFRWLCLGYNEMPNDRYRAAASLVEELLIYLLTTKLLNYFRNFSYIK